MDDSKDPLYGIARNKPIKSYKPYRNSLLGDFVVVHPLDTSIYPVWMGQALKTMQLDQNHS